MVRVNYPHGRCQGKSMCTASASRAGSRLCSSPLLSPRDTGIIFLRLSDFMGVRGSSQEVALLVTLILSPF